MLNEILTSFSSKTALQSVAVSASRNFSMLVGLFLRIYLHSCLWAVLRKFTLVKIGKWSERSDIIIPEGGKGCKLQNMLSIRVLNLMEIKSNEIYSKLI